MGNNQIYIRGEFHGLYSSGDIVMSIRDEAPSVLADRYYLIERIVIDDSNKQGLSLRGLKGIYSRGTFKADWWCSLVKEEKLVKMAGTRVILQNGYSLRKF